MPRALASVVVLAVLIALNLPSLAPIPVVEPTPAHPGNVARAPGAHPHAFPALPRGSGFVWPATSLPELPRPDNGSIRNVLVDAACASGGNAEVESAYDPSAALLYDAWIGCGGIGFARSLDGGFSFQTAFTVRGSTNGSSWDPSVAVAPNGTVLVGFMHSNATGPMPMVAWSTDHGASFSGDAVAFRPNPREFGDRDFIAVAPNGTVYLTWDYSPNASLDQIGCASGGSCYFTAGDYNIVLVASSDGGRNWSSPVPVSAGYPNGGAPCGPLTVARDGTVDVLYEGYQVTIVNATTHLLGPGLNYFARSTDGGRTFSTPTAVSNLTFPTTDWWINGAVTLDASGTLYATFDSINATSDTAYVVLSQDGGATWSTPIRLNPDVDGAPHIMAQAVGGGNGTAYVAWMTNNSSAGWSVLESVLSGNGTTLSAPIRLSDQFGADGYWVGDTIGVSSLGGGRVAVSWTYAVNVSGQLASQIFSATVGEPLPGAPTITAVLPGVAGATVQWAASTTGGPSDAFEVDWGIEGQFVYRQNVSGTTRSLALQGLVANARYLIEVAAVDSAGTGAFSPVRLLVLTAWGALRGSVVPSTAQVSLDHVPLAVALDGSFFANSSIGAHLLTAVAAGFLPTSDPVALPWNATISTPLDLAPAPGAVAGVVSPPSATVTFDGRTVTLGAGGGYQVQGPAGSVHLLNASLLGYLPVSHPVTLPQNSTLWLNLTLVQQNGTLELEVLPATANLTVSGMPIPLDAAGFANLSRAPGRYTISARSPGFLPWTENVTVTSFAQLVRVNLTPVAAPGGSGGGLFSGSGGEYPLLGALLVVAAAGFAFGVVRRRGRAAREVGAADPSPEEVLGESEGSGPEPTGPGPG